MFSRKSKVESRKLFRSTSNLTINYGVDRSTNVRARSRATSNQARGLDSLDALDRLDDLDF